MGLIFKQEHIRLILEGKKTQTRRQHKRVLKAGKIYNIKSNWVHKTGHRILITRVYRQRLGDTSSEEAQKEGGYTLEEFKDVWKRINGNWDSDDIVVVYEFKLMDLPKPSSLNEFMRARKRRVIASPTLLSRAMVRLFLGKSSVRKF